MILHGASGGGTQCHVEDQTGVPSDLNQALFPKPTVVER